MTKEKPLSEKEHCMTYEDIEGRGDKLFHIEDVKEAVEKLKEEIVEAEDENTKLIDEIFGDFK